MASLFEELRSAVDQGNVAETKRLLQLGADKDERFAKECFFHDWMDLEMIRLLAEAGADINALSNDGEWALRNAAEKGDMAAVSYLLSAGADPNLQASGGPAIHTAVCRDNIEIVRLLLEAGADINAQDADQWTCLWWLRSTEKASFLLSKGADPSIPADTMIGCPDQLPEDWDTIPEIVRNLLRAHRLKT